MKDLIKKIKEHFKNKTKGCNECEKIDNQCQKCKEEEAVFMQQW